MDTSPARLPSIENDGTVIAVHQSFAQYRPPVRFTVDTWAVATKDNLDDGTERQRFRKLAQAAMNADITVGQLDTIIGDLGGALTDFDKALGGFDVTLDSFGSALDDFSATLSRVDATVTTMVTVVERLERIVGRVENIVDLAEALIAPVTSAESMVRGLLGIGRRR
jgi:ABC-type transporter Mla subunit MlaD